MVKITPEPRKTVKMSVAISPEMKEQLAQAAERLGMRGGVSELLRVLAQNFLDGKFNGIEDLQKHSTPPNKARYPRGKKQS